MVSKGLIGTCATAMVVQPQQQQPAALSSSYPAIRPGKVAPPEVPILASAGAQGPLSPSCYPSLTP